MPMQAGGQLELERRTHNAESCLRTTMREADLIQAFYLVRASSHRLARVRSPSLHYLYRLSSIAHSLPTNVLRISQPRPDTLTLSMCILMLTRCYRQRAHCPPS